MNEVATVPTRILVPVDLSQRSRKAIEYAAMLGSATGAELVLTTNINLPERAALEDYARGEKISVEAAAKTQLLLLARQLAPDVPATAVVSSSDYPADGILSTAEREAVDMIVIASHGRSGMTRWLLGSIAEKIARSSTVPVVVVPARDASGGQEES